jgi:hypothetical protein
MTTVDDLRLVSMMTVMTLVDVDDIDAADIHVADITVDLVDDP